MKRFGVSIDFGEYRALFRTQQEALDYAKNVLHINENCEECVHEIEFYCQAGMTWWIDFGEMTLSFTRTANVSFEMIDEDIRERFRLWWALGGRKILDVAVRFDTERTMNRLKIETAEIWSELTIGEEKLFREDVRCWLEDIYGQFASIEEEYAEKAEKEE